MNHFATAGRDQILNIQGVQISVYSATELEGTDVIM